MLSLQLPFLKKSDAAPVAAPLWHPNFRNFERLPDTKVVRTKFFVNAAAVALALGLLLWTGNQELRLRELRLQIADAQSVIDKNQKQNSEAMQQSKLFAAEEKKITEIAGFTKLAILPQDLVLLLGSALPKEVQLESVDVRYAEGANNGQCVLRGLVAGTKEKASGSATNYVESLRTNPKFAAIFESVTLTTINTDPRTGLLNFEIVLKFKAPGKKA